MYKIVNIKCLYPRSRHILFGEGFHKNIVEAPKAAKKKK